MGRHEGKPPIRLTRPVYVIGSRSSARIHLVSSSVSKAHAILVRSNGRTYIRDLASRTKVIINDRDVREAELEDDDIIKIGSFTFKYVAAPGEDVPRPSRDAAPAKLDITGADYPVPIEQRVILIGRRSICDVNLTEASVSTAHAVIFELDGQRFIRDLGSRTGTFVNGVSTHQHQLAPGDNVRIGETDLRYLMNEVGSAIAVDESEAIPDLMDLESETAPAAFAAPGAPVSRRPVDELLTVDADDVPADEVEEAVEEEVIAPPPVARPVARAPLPIDDEPLALEPEIEAEPELAEEPVAEVEPEEQPAAELEPELAADEEAIPMDEPEIAPVSTTPLEVSFVTTTEEGSAAEPATTIARDADDHLDLSDLLSKKQPVIEGEIVEPPAIPAVDVPVEEIVTAGDVVDVAADSIEFAGGNEPAGAVLDVDALASGGEVAADFDLDFKPPQPQEEFQEIDLSAVDLSEPEIEEGFESGPVEALDAKLILGQDSLSSDNAADSAAEPLLDLVAPIAGTEQITSVEEATPEAAPQESPLIESSAMVEAPSAESIELEPAPIQTPLAEAPVVPTEAPLTEPAAPVEMTSDPELQDLQPDASFVVPVKKPRKRPVRKKPKVDAVEVIENTEPTPESALQSAAEQLAIESLSEPSIDSAKDSGVVASASVEDLTDTKFDRAVREFTGTEIGDIVEPQNSTKDQHEKGATYGTSDVAPSAEPAAELTESQVADLLDAGLPELELPPPDQDTVSQLESDFDLGQPGAPALNAPVKDLPIQRPAAPVKAKPAADEPVQQVPRPVQARTSEPPTSGPAMPKQWGANQDNFLGGVPLNLWGSPAPAAEPPPVPQAPRSPFGDSKAPPPFGLPPRPTRHQPLPANERVVKELIDEIDTVAAAAEAAAKAPPPSDTDEDPPMMGAIPPRPRRGAPQRPQHRRRIDSIPDTTAADPTRGTVTTGFDGLAMPPVRELDVFSQHSVAPQIPDAGALPGMAGMTGATANLGITSGDLLGATVPPMAMTEDGRAESMPPGRDLSGDDSFEEEFSDEDVQSARGVVPRASSLRPSLPAGSIDGMMQNDRRPQVAYAAELSEAEVADVRRRYVRRIVALGLVMLMLMGGAAFGIYNYLGVNSITEGSIRFTNLANWNKRDRDLVQDQQRALISDNVTRTVAKDELPAIYKAGFLAVPVEYSRIASSAAFSDAAPDTMVIKVHGTDADGDRARVLAMMNALYKANFRRTEDANRERRSVEDLKKEIELASRDLKTVSDEITRLRAAGESRPSAEQIAALNTQIDALNKAWESAVTASKNAQIELDRLKAAPVQGAAAGAAAAGGNPDDDEKIRSMQLELNTMLTRLNEARTVNNLQAATAKKNLDAALDSFQKQVADAQAMMNGNPEIAAFIKSAQELQQTTRTLTDDLIRTQEQEYSQLTVLKDRLNEMMQQRRADVWTQDKELGTYKERLEILKLQYGASVGGGLAKEAEDLKAKIDLTQSMIKARQDLLPGDAFYSEAIQQLQGIVDSHKKNIEENRAKAERQLSTLQQAFRNNQLVQKLPQEQKQLAEQLQSQVAQINDARKSYNTAVDAGAEEADGLLKSQISTLQVSIEARRKQLAEGNLQNLKNQQEQSRLTAIEAKQAEVTKLMDAEKEAREAYFAKNRELSDLKVKLAEASKNDEMLDAMIRQKGDIESKIPERNRTLEMKQASVNNLVEAIKPNPNTDLATTQEKDRRLLFMSIACGSILVFFTILIMWNVHSLSLEAPPMSIRSADLQPVDEPQNGAKPSNGKPANGQSNGNGTEDDHEPAVV